MNVTRVDCNKERAMRIAIRELNKTGIKLDYQDENEIKFYWNGDMISFWPYSRWYRSNTIEGRGLSSLLKKLKAK